MIHPAVSIGLPVYNGGAQLRQVLDSLLAQTFEDFELIVSDNASTDTTEALCREFCARDRRVRHVRQSENIGGSANFKFVLNEARGRYFTWAAADDLRSPDFIEENIRFLEAHPDYVASTCPNCFEGQDPHGPDLVTFAIDDKDPAQRLQTFLDHCWVSHGIFYSVIRTDILKACDIIGPWFLGADWAVDLFLARQGPIHRTGKGLMVSGEKGLSNSRDAWSAFRSGPLSWVLPFHRVSAYAWRLSAGLPWRQRYRLLRRLWRLNLFAAWNQIWAEYYPFYRAHIRPWRQKWRGIGS